MEDSNRRQKQGKTLGKIAFLVSEFLVILSIIAVVMNVLLENSIDTNLIGQIFLFQGTIFTVTWGAKASSNFAKKSGQKEDTQ